MTRHPGGRDDAGAISAPRGRWWLALACASVGMAVFQFFGNANRGYIDTASLFHWWGFQWLNPRSETEHGWIVLAVSAGLLAWKLRNDEGRGANGECISESSTFGIWNLAFAAMAAGLALHAVGFAAQQARLSIIAFLIFTWGVLRFGGGKRWGAAAAFPLGFMVFAIPVNVLDSAGFWLQMGVVRATTAIAHLSGIEVVRNGTQLFAPDGRYQYDVVAACSGVRSLVALTALSVLAGYLSFRGWGRRAAVLLLCFPLVYAGNVARLSAIVFAAQIGGQKWGDIAHEVMGFGVFAIVLGGVLGAVVLMERWWPEQRVAPRSEISDLKFQIDLPSAAGHRGRDPLARLRRTRAYLITAAVAGLAIGEMFFLHKLASSPPRGSVGIALSGDGLNPIELPSFLGTEWIGRRTEITAIEREILPPDTGYSRKEYVAVNDPAKRVLLSLVLSGRDRTSIHRPELCLVGQGWTIEGRVAHRFDYREGPGSNFPATVLRVRREVTTPRGKIAVPQLVAYWFVGADRVVATHWERVALDAWNRVVHARADRWAYALMQTDATDGEAAALQRMQAILDATLVVFQEPGPARALANHKSHLSDSK